MEGAAGEPPGRRGKLVRGACGREQGRTLAAPPGAGGGPHKEGGSGRATVWGARAGLRRRPRPLRAHTSNLLLVTPFTSLLMGPAGAARAGRCGVWSAKTGARAGPGVPGAGGGGGKAPLALPTRRRDCSSAAGASTTARGVRGRDDCQSLARSSQSLNFNPKQKHSQPASNAAPHWTEPPGPRNAGGGEERSAAVARAHPSPTRRIPGP